MNITATDILTHCNAACEGRAQSPAIIGSFEIGGFWISRCGYYLEVFADSSAQCIEQAALLLGLDRPSPAPVVLEWAEDEYGRPTARFNSEIEAMCYYIGGEWHANVIVAGYQIYFFSDGKNTLDEARAWCVAQITKIITPTPKP